MFPLTKFRMLMSSFLFVLLSTVGMKEKPLTDILSCYVRTHTQAKAKMQLNFILRRLIPFNLKQLEEKGQKEIL